MCKYYKHILYNNLEITQDDRSAPSLQNIALRTRSTKSWAEPVFVDLLRSPGIDSQPCGPVRQPYLLYRPAKLQRLAESISRNRFPGSLNVYKYGLRILEHLAGQQPTGQRKSEKSLIRNCGYLYIIIHTENSYMYLS
jgi:hypothetical protein